MAARIRSGAARFALLASLALPSTGCEDAFPANLSRFTPPPQYALWWQEAELCSGTNGDLARVRWYRSAPGEAIAGSSGNVLGQYDARGHRIALRWDVTEDPRVVRHEMLHALHPRVGHPRDLFRQRCGDVVACTGDCAVEAGPAPTVPPEIRRVSPRDLEVSVMVSPATPGPDIFDGHFTLAVVARNPFAEPVMVDFPDSSLVGGSRVFGYRLGEDPSGAQVVLHGFGYDRGVGFFRAHEAKRAVFDWRVAEPGGPPVPRPGAHFALGLFGNASSDTIRFTIRGPD